MNKQKLRIFLTVVALIGIAAGALTWLKANQHLGKPGIKATAIPGSVAMNIDLPERVLDFASEKLEQEKVVLDFLPKDTSYAQRRYTAPDGFRVTANIILMGADRSSIHRPEYCLPGQGWRIDEKKRVGISVVDTSSYELPVMKWVVSNSAQSDDGHKVEVRGVYLFWYAADNELTSDNLQLQRSIMKKLIFTGVLQRWAYISYFSVCYPGQEEATLHRMTDLIAASAPEFQIMPRTTAISTAGK